MNTQQLLLLTLSATLVWGCDVTWSDGSGYDNAVFSETGESVAMVFQTYEQKNNMKYLEKRNFETQVIIVDDTGNKQALTNLALGDVADLFYQEEAGYLIIGRQGEKTEGEDGSEYGWTAYERVALDGTVTPLSASTGVMMLSCDGGTSKMSVEPPVRWIPSPDGAVLARIDAEISCANRELTLTFVDAQSLEVLTGPIPLDNGGQTVLDGGAAFWNTFSMAWTVEGAFAIGNWAKSNMMDHLMADVYSPGSLEPTEELMHFGCFSAATQSHYATMDSTVVQVNEEGALQITEGSEWETGFGCGDS